MMKKAAAALITALISTVCTAQDEGVSGQQYTASTGLEYTGTGLVLGQVQTGALLDIHPLMNDGTHADCYQLEATEGRRYSITLRSVDFDSYLLVGVGFCQDVMLQYENDDFEEDSLDSQIVLSADYPFYSVYVNTFEPGATGSYSLIVEELPAAN